MALGGFEAEGTDKVKAPDSTALAAPSRKKTNGAVSKLWAKLRGNAPPPLLPAQASGGPTDGDVASGLLRADSLRAERRLYDLAAHLGNLIEQFGLEPALCVRHDVALQQIGHFDAADALFSRLLTEAPDAIECMAEMAEAARTEGNFGIAANRWKSLCGLQPERERFHMGYIRSLSRIFETDVASAHFEAFADRFDSEEFQLLRVEILEVQSRCREALSALDDFSRDKVKSPAVAIKRGVYLRSDGRLEEAEELFQALQRSQPENYAVGVQLAKTASAARDYALASERWRALCEAYPGRAAIHSGYIESLLNLPDIERAQAHYDAVCDRLDNKPFRFHQLIKIHHFANDLDGAMELLEAYLEQFQVGQEPIRLRAPLLQKKAQFLMRRHQNARGNSPYLEMKSVLEDVMALQPWNVLARFQWCKTLVALDMEDEAKRVIDDMPRTLHPKIVGLRMWRANRSGDHKGARALWDHSKKVHFIPHIEPCRPGLLRRRDDNPVGTDRDEIRVFTAIRNEKWRLPWFLDYYRTLGVNRFFFVDNNSSDGSGEFLLEQPDVHVFWTDDSYAASYSAMKWVNQLSREYGRSGWVSYVDVDEALVFPGVEKTDLRYLTDYMESRDHEALQAFMLDMFSEETQLITEAGHVDFVRSYPLFDSRIDKNATINCPYVEVRGGVRQLFGWGEFLTKTPLIRGGRDIAFLQSSHIISPAHVSDVTAALLHFKLVGDFRETFLADLADNSRIAACRRRYLHYERYLQANGGKLRLSNDFTERYLGSEQLLELGLIGAPDAFGAAIGERRAGRA